MYLTRLNSGIKVTTNTAYTGKYSYLSSNQLAYILEKRGLLVTKDGLNFSSLKTDSNTSQLRRFAITFLEADDLTSTRVLTTDPYEQLLLTACQHQIKLHKLITGPNTVISTMPASILKQIIDLTLLYRQNKVLDLDGSLVLPDESIDTIESNEIVRLPNLRDGKHQDMYTYKLNELYRELDVLTDKNKQQQLKELVGTSYQVLKSIVILEDEPIGTIIVEYHTIKPLDLLYLILHGTFSSTYKPNVSLSKLAKLKKFSLGPLSLIFESYLRLNNYNEEITSETVYEWMSTCTDKDYLVLDFLTAYGYYLEKYGFEVASTGGMFSLRRTVQYDMFLTSQEELNDLAKVCGMIIPQVTSPDIYFCENIMSYLGFVGFTKEKEETFDMVKYRSLDLNGRINCLKTYRDDQLLEIFKVKIAYTNRLDFILYLSMLADQKLFFIPLCINIKHCINQQTISTFDDVSDPNVFIVAYGTLDKYFCYTIEDFLSTFKVYAVNGTNREYFMFRKPENLQASFHRQDITYLLLLLSSCYQEFSSVKDLIRKVTRLMVDGLNKTTQEVSEELLCLEAFGVLLDSTSLNLKDEVRKVLYQLFYIGMYMRQWKGPDHPYPVEEKDTVEATLDNQTTVVPDQLDKLLALLEEVSSDVRTFIRSLVVFNYFNDPEEDIVAPILQYLTINQLLEQVSSSKEKDRLCIRVASKYIVSTAYYYLDLLLNEKIPNLAIGKLAAID